MNRHKYRAWDGKLIHTVSELCWMQGGMKFYGPGVGEGWIQGTVDIKKFPELAEEATCVLIQYTGLKDKDDEEIYEGDIISISGRFQPGKVFDRLGCWFVESGQELGYYCADDIEIIGNIYENPELIK